MQAISLRTTIPGPKSQALLSRRKAAVPQGPFNIAPIFVKRGDGRGLGAMMAMELVKDRQTKELAKEFNVGLIKRCVENGAILIYAGTHSNILRLLVPLVITDAQLDERLDVIERQLTA